MKIETHLSPNCSEATFIVVDWKTKLVQDTWQESDESLDAEGIGSFISCIWEYLEKNASVVAHSNGNGFHPELLEILMDMHQKGIKMLERDSPAMNVMAEELLEANDGKYKEIIYKHMKSKVELLAEGFYGGKKNGTKTIGR